MPVSSRWQNIVISWLPSGSQDSNASKNAMKRQVQDQGVVLRTKAPHVS